ncbi:hypothetical protein BpHYR1_010745 [Brachionus plicatilis]|uniref:Uncharacterized protein n=1 Tax=Brachionus plicatilis TaxID=10195 RepID=A0A3M7PBM7_BRAPC|nr:hypothetical protein BpHYR1_010745 [Brachionus plicatilis]
MLPDVCLKFSMCLNAFSRTVGSRIDPSMQVRHACTNSFSSSSIFWLNFVQENFCCISASVNFIQQNF